jgi:hypothetical protein
MICEGICIHHKAIKLAGEGRYATGRKAVKYVSNL